MSNLITNLSSQNILDSMRNPVSVVDKEGITRYANPSFIYTTGIPSKDLIGKQLLDTLCADSISKKQREEWKNEFQRTIKSGEATSSEYTIKREDDLAYLASTTSVLRNEEGETIGAIISFTNIRDAKETMQELRKLQRAAEHSPVSVVVTDAEGIIEYVNPKFAQLTGYSVEESIGQNPRILQSGQTPTETHTDLWKTILSGHEWRGVFINKKKDGVIYWEDAWISPIKGPSGDITHFVAVKEDITSRLKAEKELSALTEELEKRVEERTEELRESEEQYRGLFQNAQVGLFRTRGRDGKIVACNETGSQMLGFNSPDDVMFQYVVSENFVDPYAYQQMVDLLTEDGKVINFQTQVTKRDGSPIWVEFSSILYQEESFLHVVVDITERKRGEQSLIENEALLRATIEATADGILVVDNDRRVLLTNTRYAELMQIPEEIVDTCDSQLLLDATLDHIKDPIGVKERIDRLCGSPRVALDMIEFNGERIYETYTSPLRREGEIVGRVWSFRDITEKKQAEKQARRRAEVNKGINRILVETLTARTDEEVARACLDVAQEITKSEFGLVGDLTQDGKFDTIALTNPGWEACYIDGNDASLLLKGMTPRSVLFKALLDGESVIDNNPAPRPESVGIPDGQPPILNFMGVPLKRANESIGMIGLAGKEDGFDKHDKENIESISVAFIEALNRTRADQRIIHTRDRAEFFVDLMSHDLSNINQAIVGTLELLLYDDSLQEHVAETVREALYQVQRGTHLIMNVRKFTKIDNESLEISQQDPAAALEAAIRAVDDDVPLKTLHVKTNFAQGEFQVQSSDYLTDVFYSLLHNALRYDPNDEVEAQVSIGTSEDGTSLRIEVSDQGPGIPDTYKDKLFERIALKKEGYLGTGIGLTLLKHIVNHSGGEVWVEDRMKGDHSKGAKFVLLLPGGEA